MPDIIVTGYVSIKHIHAPQQVVVKAVQLRVLKPVLPVVGHQLQVCSDGMQPVRVYLMRMNSQESFQRNNGFTEIAVKQMIIYDC